MLPFSHHTPDIAVLRAASTRIILAAGQESVGEPPHQAALALADRLGTASVIFPGGHGGFGTHADGYALELRSLFADS